MSTNDFTVAQVATILECKASEVAQIGQVITPESPGRGKGNRSKYSFRNIVEVQIFRLLTQFGVPRKRIREYIQNLTNLRFPWLDHNNVSGWISLDDKWGWSAGQFPNDVLEITMRSHPVDGAVVINIGQMKQKLIERIEELKCQKN